MHALLFRSENDFLLSCSCAAIHNGCYSLARDERRSHKEHNTSIRTEMWITETLLWLFSPFNGWNVLTTRRSDRNTSRRVSLSIDSCNRTCNRVTTFSIVTEMIITEAMSSEFPIVVFINLCFIRHITVLWQKTVLSLSINRSLFKTTGRRRMLLTQIARVSPDSANFHYANSFAYGVTWEHFIYRRSKWCHKSAEQFKQ